MVPTSLVRAASNLSAHEKDLTKLKKACDGMESSFLRQLLSTMRESVKETSLGGDNTGMDNFKTMADGAIADRLAQRGTLGISDLTFRATASQVLNQQFNQKKS